MIEQVEEFRSEFDAHPLTDIRSLEYSEVKIVHAFAAKSGIDARFAAESPVRRRGKATCIEPLRCSPRAALVASRHHIRPYISNSEVRSFQCGRCTGPGDLQRETTLECGDPIDPPSGDCAVRKSIHARQELPAMAERKIENVADDETLRNVL